MKLDRRQFLGCAAVALAAAPAEAAPLAAAPRLDCPHALCRHYRALPAGGGFCAFALKSPPISEHP